jgi:sugar phosphate permease
MVDGDASERVRHRNALAVSWLAYASSYLGRKGFSAVKKPLQADLGLSTLELGLIDTGFLGAYALGQFVTGVLADRLGSRRVVGIGLLGSAAACALFGLSQSAGLLIACFALNGVFQATGWPGNTRVVAEWTPPERRGRVMSRWSTCYQVGGFVATPLAVVLVFYGGLRAAFFGPALVLAAMGVVSLALLRSPRVAPATEREEQASRRPLADQLIVFKSPLLWLYGTSYFFIKLVRYALLFWLPYYLGEVSGHSTTEAGFIASAFDAGGVVGVLAMGPWSDRSRFTRPGLSALWLVGLAAALGVYALLGRSGIVANVLLLGLIGALLFGPDSLLSGAAAMDAGGERAAATSAGFVNGLGSLGAVLQGLVVPGIAFHFGWTALFPVFVALSLLAALVLLPAARAARKLAGRAALAAPH